MTKKLLELLTAERLKESKLLLDGKCFSGAYYLAGYAVECSLKACISKQINSHEIPAKEFINNFYVHDLERLIRTAGIDTDYQTKLKSDSDFSVNWSLVRSWKEDARYKEWSQVEAMELYDAITNTKGGVLLWIQQYW